MELKQINEIINNKQNIKKEKKIKYTDLFNIPKKKKTKSKTKKK